MKPFLNSVSGNISSVFWFFFAVMGQLPFATTLYAKSGKWARLMGVSLLAGGSVFSEPVISEFMASNKTTLRDEDGEYSDWIEIHNPDASAVSLLDWSLTDSQENKTKWKFPATTLPADSYLIVYASNKNRRDPDFPLHANFALSADGEYLGLIKPDGITATCEFAPGYPPQSDDVSYGVIETATPDEPPQTGYFQIPSPGAPNGSTGSPTTGQVVSFSVPSGLFSDTLTLGLAGNNPDQKIRYVLAAPSGEGADVAGPTAASSEYTGPIALTSSQIVRAAIFSADDVQSGTIATAQYIKLALTGGQGLADFSSQLPLLVLDNHGFGPLVKDGVDRAGWVYGFAPDDTGAATLSGTGTFALPVAFGVRGNSSAFFPKQSFKMKFRNTLGRKQTLAPFGLPAFDKWQLLGPWNFDRSFIRNAYAYALSNRLGLWAPRTHFVEVFINHDSDGLDAADYAGIYVLTDKIEPDPRRIAIASLDSSDNAEPAVSGGYILKIDWPDAGDYSFTTHHGHTLILDTPDIDDLTAEQAGYIQNYFQAMEDALSSDSASGWATHSYLGYINRDSWIDFHLLNTLAKNADAFVGSSFFNKDRGGKINAGPLWDFDRSMGAADSRTTKWDEWRANDDGDGWNAGWWGQLVRDPDFMQGWIDRWQSLRKDALSDTSLAALAADLSNEIGTAAADRDSALYPNDLSQYPGGYAGEIDHLKEWLRNRARWIDEQFLAPPILVKNGRDVTLIPAAGAQLVYTLDATDPRASGGQQATGAITSSSPVVLADTDLIVARSYRANPRFPTTPWSRRVSLDDAIAAPPPPVLGTIRNTTAASGKGARFSAGDTPGFIQWQVSTDRGTTWTDLADNDVYSGTATATLAIARVDAGLDGAQYRYVATDYGTAYTGNVAVLTVEPAFFPFPTGIVADASGNLFVSDANTDTIQKINPSSQVSVLVGAAGNSGFNRPGGLEKLSDNTLVAADTANAVIRRIAADGTLSVLAGQSGIRGSTDGMGAAATFSSPRDVARDTNGTVYVADSMNNTIRKISPSGMVTTFAGTAGASGTLDANGAAARFNLPSSITVDRHDNVFVSDTTNNTIRKITPSGDVTTLAGLPGVSGFENGTGIGALFNQPRGLAVDDSGNVFVADTGNSTIRKITPERVVTTLAGTPGIAGTDDGVGGEALFNQPRDLTIDASGNLYVVDTGNALIRKVTPAGEVSIVSLNAMPSDNGGGGGSSSGGGGGDPLPNTGGGGGGGGGALAPWFIFSLALLATPRLSRKAFRRRR